MIRLCSYDCRGWRSGSDNISTIVNSRDIVLIQEHWLLPEHIGALNISQDCLSTGVLVVCFCGLSLIGFV